MGILDDLLEGLGNPNPLTSMGLGILAASSRPGQTTAGAIGEGALMGMQNVRRQQIMNLQQQQIEAVLQERQAKQEAAEQEAARVQSLRAAASGSLPPELAQFLPPDDLARMMADPYQTPDSIKKLTYLMDNPAAMAAEQQLRTSAAPKVDVNLPGQDYIPTTDLAKVYNVETGEVARPGLTYDDLRSGKYAIKQEIPVEQQRRVSYIATAELAAGALDKFVEENPDFNPGGYEHIAGEMPLVGPKLKGQKKRQFDALASVAITSVLRPDTGAAATADEKADYSQTYVPQIGDSEATQNFKRELYKQRIEALKAGVPEQYQLQFFENDKQRVLEHKRQHPGSGETTSSTEAVDYVYDPVTGTLKKAETGGGF